MERLIKKIRREIKRSPAKAAVLGSLVLVAVAIWGSKLAATPSPGVQESSMSSISLNPQPKVPEVGPSQENKQTTTEVNLELHAWQMLQAWRTQPFDPPILERDPFATEAVGNVQPSNDTSNETSTSPPSPEDLGIHFTGVIIAGHDRTAILENQPVRAGSTLKIERDGRSHFVKILEVTRTGIRLSIDGAEFEQVLPDLGLGNGVGDGP